MKTRGYLGRRTRSRVSPPRPRNQVGGLGDLLAKATATIGIKPCAGCKKRQEKLNKLVPFGGD